jgi:formylglycine-generating enzyme required for sulfatase activity
MVHLAGGGAPDPPGFCLDAREATVAAWRACMHDGHCPAPGDGAGCDGTSPPGDLPINCVSVVDAQAFCAARGARLPDAREWAFAARGGPAATRFPWGDEAPGDRPCWDGAGNDLAAGARRGPCPAGSHPRGDSPQGASDLAGNLAEWTRGGGGAPVALGGSFATFHAARLGASAPPLRAPSERERDRYTGFRCATDGRRP